MVDVGRDMGTNRDENKWSTRGQANKPILQNVIPKDGNMKSHFLECEWSKACCFLDSYKKETKTMGNFFFGKLDFEKGYCKGMFSEAYQLNADFFGI